VEAEAPAATGHFVLLAQTVRRCGTSLVMNTGLEMLKEALSSRNLDRGTEKDRRNIKIGCHVAEI
jgi:hypothetical protein